MIFSGNDLKIIRTSLIDRFEELQNKAEELELLPGFLPDDDSYLDVITELFNLGFIIDEVSRLIEKDEKQRLN